jgi:hypothetical protein
MSDAFRRVVDSMRGKPLAAVRADAFVQACKSLRGEEAAAFLRAYRAHLRDAGPLSDTHGAASDIAAFTIAEAIVPHATVDAGFLLERIGWPTKESWDATMLALAGRGELSPAHIAAALASPGFAAAASALLPFGSDPWATALREQVAAWPAERRETWTELVELARTADLPLRPSREWLTAPKMKQLRWSLERCLDDVCRCLERFASPVEGVVDLGRRSGLALAAEENAKLLHALVLVVAAERPDGWQSVVTRVRDVASSPAAGLGTYLPKLAARAALALEAARR